MVGVALPLVFFACFFLWPVLSIVSLGFFGTNVFDFGLTGQGQTSGFMGLSKIISILSDSVVLNSVWYTVFLATVSSLCSLFLGLPYVFYKLDFSTRKFWRTVIMVPFVLPTTVVGVAFRGFFAENGLLGFLNLDGSVVAIVIAMVFFNVCVVVRIVGMFWQGFDHRLLDAARLLGADSFRVFRTILLPALTPSIISAFCVVFLFCSTSFGVVLIMGGSVISTVETQIFISTTQFLDLETASVLSVLQFVLVAVVLFVTSRYGCVNVFKQELFVSKKSARTLRKPVRQDWLLVVFAFLVVLVLFIAPMLNLVLKSFVRNGEYGLVNYVDLFSTDLSLTSSISVWQACVNSFLIAVTAAFIAVVVGFFVSFVVSRRKTGVSSRVRGLFDLMFVVPLGVSAATVGFGFLITVNVLVYDTVFQWLLLPVVQASVAVPLVVRSVLPVVRGIDVRQIEVSYMLGASLWRSFITVEGVYFFHALLGAFGLALAVSFGEFGATAFLFRPDGATLPVLIYSLVAKPFAVQQGMANAACVVLVLFSASAMMIGQRFAR